MIGTRGTGAGRGYSAPVAFDGAAVAARALLALAQLEADERLLDALAAAGDAGPEVALRRLAVAERLAAIRWARGGAQGTRVTDDLSGRSSL